MQERCIALAFQSLQQTPHVPFALANLLGCLPLGDQSLLGFLQGDQPVAVLLRHEKCS